MSQDNDKKYEQHKSESQVASLKNQAEGNVDKDTDAATDHIAENLKQDKSDK